MSLNRAERRLSEKNGRTLQKKEWNEFQDVTKEAVSKHLHYNPQSTFRPDFVFQNNKYIVQVFMNQIKNDKEWMKVMVRRSDAEPIYSWNDLYRIKNELFGEEVEAVQFMPKVSELVDQANLYWFFIEQTEIYKDQNQSAKTNVNGQICPECGNTENILVDKSGHDPVFECRCGQYWK